MGEHLTIIQIFLGVISALSSLAVTIMFWFYGQLSKRVSRLEDRMDEDSDKMDAKKVNSELWEAIQKQTDEKLKCLDEKSAELKRTMEKGFRKLDRVAMCVGLIAKKYGIEMKEEGEGE